MNEENLPMPSRAELLVECERLRAQVATLERSLADALVEVEELRAEVCPVETPEDIERQKQWMAEQNAKMEADRLRLTPSAFAFKWVQIKGLTPDELDAMAKAEERLKIT